MAINTNKDKNIPADTEACYETLASQEEIYLEESEERARAVLISESPSPSDREAQEIVNNNGQTIVNPAEELGHVAEELITGDSDDPPLSAEEVGEMVKRP
jgi:hypothetical protein